MANKAWDFFHLMQQRNRDLEKDQTKMINYAFGPLPQWPLQTLVPVLIRRKSLKGTEHCKCERLVTFGRETDVKLFVLINCMVCFDNLLSV